MKSALVFTDAAHLHVQEDIFDIEDLYVETIHTDPSRALETLGRQGYFHPSAIGMCSRRNVYEAIRAPLTPGVPDVDSMEIFAMGHKVHDHVQRVLGDVGRVCESRGLAWDFEAETPTDKETDELFLHLRTGGTADGVLAIAKPGEWEQRGVLEIKSMKDELWQKLRAPKPDHEFQATLYAFRWNVPIIWYWYFNKNNSQRKVFRRYASEETLGKAMDRLQMFNDHFEAGTLPEREESFFMCPRCEYKNECKPPSLAKLRAPHQRKGVGKKQSALIKKGVANLGRRRKK